MGCIQRSVNQAVDFEVLGYISILSSRGTHLISLSLTMLLTFHPESLGSEAAAMGFHVYSTSIAIVFARRLVLSPEFCLCGSAVRTYLFNLRRPNTFRAQAWVSIHYLLDQMRHTALVRQMKSASIHWVVRFASCRVFYGSAGCTMGWRALANYPAWQQSTTLQH